MKKYLLVFLMVSGSWLFAQNNALDFDGSDDFASIPDNSAHKPASITVEAWVKVNANESTKIGQTDLQFVIFKKNSRSNEFEGYTLYYSENTGCYEATVASSGGTQIHSTSTAVNLGEWNHLALIANSTSLTLYLNGVSQGAASTGFALDYGSEPLYFGRTGSGSWEGYFSGDLDEVRIWNVIRTEAQIRQYMYHELVGNETDLAAYYNFNETAGTTLDDLTSSDNNGTLNNMTNDDWIPSSAIFGPKNCLVFDGSNEYADIGTDGDFESDSLTVEAWVKPIATDGWQSIITKRSDGTPIQDFLQWTLQTNDNTDTYYSGINVGDSVYWADSHVPVSTEWIHLAMTFDGEALKFYANGVLKEENTGPSGTMTSKSLMKVYIANRVDNDNNWGVACAVHLFNGYLDEVRIWNIARTESQIREYMCKPLTGNESGLVVYYNFDNTTGTALQDFSGNIHDVTLTNMENSDWVSSSAFNTWLNTSSTTWSTAGNWSNGVPASGANVGIYNFTNEPDIPASQTFGSLYIGSSTGTTLSASMTVNGSLILDKDLDLNGQTITLGSSANLVENSGRLYGSSGTITTTRSLNNIDENVARLGAEITSAANLGSTTLTRSHAAPGSQAIERKYYINPTTNTGLNATLVFHYDDNELNSQTESALELYKSADGSSWTEQSASTVNASDNTITLASIDGFSYWTAAPSGSDQSLPVEMTSFTAESHSGGVLLQWRTESETENLGFIIQRRQETGDWKQVADYTACEALTGHGSTREAHGYSYTDQAVQPGTTYQYRLADVDYSGKITWHKEVEIKVEAEDAQLPQEFGLQKVFPNPFNPALNIRYYLNADGATTLTIFNLRGQLVETLVSAYQPQGVYDLNWQPVNLSTGIYIILLQSGNRINLQKIVLVK